MQHRAEPTCAAFTSTSPPSKLFQRQNKLLPVLGPKQKKKELKLDASSARLNTWNSLTLGPEATTASPPEINYLLKGREERVPDSGDSRTLHPVAPNLFAAAADSCDSSKSVLQHAGSSFEKEEVA